MEESRKKMLKNLPREEQLETLRYLSKICFSTGRRNEIDNYQFYRKVMMDISGIDTSQKTREHVIAHARFMVCYRMRQDGNSTPYIGKLVGLDHSTIAYATRYMEDMFMYPALRKKELAMWNTFINKCKSMVKFTEIDIGDNVTICCNKGGDCEKCKGISRSSPMTVVGKMASLEHTDQGFFYLDFLENTKTHWTVKPSEICNYENRNQT